MVSRDPHDWWGSRKVTLMLELLEGRGVVAVVGRRGKQRVWDLAERWYPPGVETVSWAEAKEVLEERRWRALGVRLVKGEWQVHPDATDGKGPPRATLPSPLDPPLPDRHPAEALFGFFFRLPMYVPQAE